MAPNSPADKAGLHSGDVIRAINGRTVTTADDVQEAVSEVSVGDNLNLSLQRSQQTLRIVARPEALPE